jgi:hypothetical protein
MAVDTTETTATLAASNADTKEPEIGSAELGPGSTEEPSEPATSRAELWAWWAYYFGNNSSGPLSYTPLSTYRFLSPLIFSC